MRGEAQGAGLASGRLRERWMYWYFGILRWKVGDG